MLDNLQVLDGLEALDSFEALNGLKVLISLEVLNVSEWLASPKSADWRVGYETFRIVKGPS